MKEMQPALGVLLQQRRESLGLSRRQLGERIGSTGSGTTIMRIESGEIRRPRSDLLTALAEALDVPFADLFAAAGYAVPAELPSFRPYLRTKYHELPPEALAELEQTFTELARKYGTQGPLPGEDEY